jgi:L-ascorbate metabolism protein UlaG (beta-lactamase superfamily)
MGEVCGYVFETPGEKCLYLAADTIYCAEVEQTIRQYHPEGIILNCCEATTPLGRLIMNLSDVEKTCAAAPQAIVIASHLDNVNHALLTRKDIIAFANKRNLSGIRVPEDGEKTVL